MNARKLFIFLSLSLTVILFQNCGAGLVTGQDSAFESNGGGYSGIKPVNNTTQPQGPKTAPSQGDEHEHTINLHEECSGKVVVYEKVGGSCAISDSLFASMLSEAPFEVKGQSFDLPTTDLTVCSEFQRNNALVIDTCDETLNAISRSSLEFASQSGGQVIIDGEFYNQYGIFNILTK